MDCCLFKMKYWKVFTVATFISNFLLILFIFKTTINTSCFNLTQMMITYVLLITSVIGNILSVLDR